MKTIPSSRIILFVEDNLADVHLLKLVLQRSGFNFDVFNKTREDEAFHLLTDFQERGEVDKINFVLLDLNLPPIGGLHLLEKIKTNALLKKIPVLIFTSSQSDSDMQKAKALQADDYVCKGITLQDFRKNILKAMAKVITRH